MHKEILRKRIGKGRTTRPTVSVTDLSNVVTDADASSHEIMVGQDTWSTASRDHLADYDFWIDIDAMDKGKRSIEQNLKACSRLCLIVIQKLIDSCNLDSCQIQTYFSGHGGFHLLLPFKLLRPFPPDQIHAAAKRFCLELASSAKSESASGASIDMALYGNNHLIRAPWSLHPMGLRKVPVSLAELILPTKRLRQIVKQRSDTFKPPLDWTWLTNKPVDKAFSAALYKLDSVSKETIMEDATNLHVQTIQQFEEDAHCMAWFAIAPNNVRNINFNSPKMFLPCMLKACGLPHDLAREVVRDFAERFSAQRYSSRRKRRERISEAEQTTGTVFRSKSEQYDFNVPGRYSSLLATAIGQRDAVGYYCKDCPRFHPHFEPHKSYRIKIEWLLKQKCFPSAPLAQTAQ